MEMKAGGYLTDGTELHDINFARIAEACGIKGIRVEKASEVDEAAADRLPHRRSVLVDAVVAKEELAIPPQIKLEQAKGFSLYMLRAIISGRGDEGHRTGENQLAQVKQKQYVEPDQGKAVIDLRSDTVTVPGAPCWRP